MHLICNTVNWQEGTSGAAPGCGPWQSGLARAGRRPKLPAMQIGVIGCGKMGTALVAGAIKAGFAEASSVRGFDPSREARSAFTDACGAATVNSPASLSSCDLLLLCTKPQQAGAALGELRSDCAALVISIAAGTPLETLENAAPAACRVIRSMPNTPALVGKGAAAFALGTSATRQDAETARDLLTSVGLAVELPESLLDAVTGLSGSGPAFGFLAIEALADGGVRNGLPRPQALQLAAQTLLGAAAMVLETGRHPGELKDMVTSPGGTTIAGVAALEAAGFRAALIDAVSAATARSAELARS